MFNCFRSTEGKFISACKDGDLTKAKSLLLSHQYIWKYHDSNNKSMLSYAVESGHYNIVEIILDASNGTTVNNYDLRGIAPLTIAISKGNFSIVKLLIKRGADETKTDNLNRTHYSDPTHLGSMAISPVQELRTLAYDLFIQQHNPISNFANATYDPLIDTYNTNREKESEFGVKLGLHCVKIYKEFDIVKKLEKRQSPLSSMSYLILIVAIAAFCVRWCFRINEDRRRNIYKSVSCYVADYFKSIYPQARTIDSLLSSSEEVALECLGVNLSEDLLSDHFLDIYELRNERYQLDIEAIRKQGGTLSSKTSNEFKSLAASFIADLKGASTSSQLANLQDISELIPRLFGELYCKCRMHFKILI